MVDLMALLEHHMSIPAKPFLSQNEVEILKTKPCQQLTRSYSGYILWLDVTDLFDHGPVITLETLEAWPGHGLGFNCMEHHGPSASAVNTAVCPLWEVTRKEDRELFIELPPVC